VKWIFCYLKGTAYVGLVYDRVGSIRSSVENFIDLDHAGDLNRKRSLQVMFLLSYGMLLVEKQFYYSLLPYPQQRLSIWN